MWQLLRRVTFPASIGSLFQSFYNLVDTFYAGKISPDALSALAKSFPIYFIIIAIGVGVGAGTNTCLLYTSPSPRDGTKSRMPSSA